MSYGNSSLPPLHHQQMQQSRSATNANQPLPLNQLNNPLYHQQYSAYGLPNNTQSPYNPIDPNQTHLNSVYGQANLNKNVVPGYPSGPNPYPPGLQPPQQSNLNPNSPNLPRRPTPTNPYQNATAIQRPPSSLSMPGAYNNTPSLHNLGPNPYSTSPYHTPYSSHASSVLPQMPSTNTTANPNELWPGQLHSSAHQSRLPYPGNYPPSVSALNNRDTINNLYNSQSSNLSTYPPSLNQPQQNSSQASHLTNQTRSYYGQPPPGLPQSSANNQPTTAADNLQSPFNQPPYSNSRYNIPPPGIPGYPPGYHPSQAAYDQSRLAAATQFNQQQQQQANNSSPSSSFNRSYGSNNNSSTSTSLQPPLNNQLSALSPKRPTPDQTVLSPMPPTSHTPDRLSSASTLSNSTNQQLSSSIGNNNLLNQQSSVNKQSVIPSASNTTNSLAQLEQMVMPHLSQPTINKQQQQTSSPYFGLNNSNNNNLPMQQQQPPNSYTQYNASLNLNNSASNYYSQYGEQPGSINSQQPQSNLSNNSMWPPPLNVNQQQLNNSNNSSITKPNTLSPNLNKSQQPPSSLANKSASGYNLFDNQYNSPGLIDNSFTANNNASGVTDDLNKKSLNNSTNLTNLTSSSNKESQSINESNSSSLYYDKMINQTIPQPTNYLNQPQSSTQDYLQQQSQSTDPNYSTLAYNSYQPPPPTQYSTSFHSNQQQTTSNSDNSSSFEMGISNNNQQLTNLNQSFSSTTAGTPTATTGLSVNNQQSTNAPNDSSNLSNSMYDQSFSNQSQNSDQPYDPYDDNGFANEPSIQTSKKKNKGRPKKDVIEQNAKKEKKPRAPRTPKANKKGLDKNNKLANQLVSSPIVPPPEQQQQQQYVNSPMYPSQPTDPYVQKPIINNMQPQIVDPLLNQQQMPNSNQPQLPQNEMYSKPLMDNNLQPTQLNQAYDTTSSAIIPPPIVNQDLMLNNNNQSVNVPNSNLIDNSNSVNNLDSQNIIKPSLIMDNQLNNNINQIPENNIENSMIISQMPDKSNETFQSLEHHQSIDYQQSLPIDQMYNQTQQPPPIINECLQTPTVMQDVQMIPQQQFDNNNDEFVQQSIDETAVEDKPQTKAASSGKAKKPKKPKKKKNAEADEQQQQQLETSTEINESGEQLINDGSLIEGEIQTPTKAKPKRPKKPRKPKKEKGIKSIENADVNDQDANLDLTEKTETLTGDLTADGNEQTLDLDEVTQSEDGKTPGSKKSKKSSTSSKPKKPRLKEGNGKKKKLPKLALKFCNKKKRKRLGSSDGSDVERTPPPSPKEDEDNSNKRRSARLTKTKLKYHEDIDLGISDVDDDDKKEPQAEVQVTNIVEDTMIVEKIMLSRMGTREIEQEDENNDENKIDEQKPAPTVEVEEFYVKYKNLSYLHCEWRTEEELEKYDRRVGQKLKRFKQKRDSMFTFDFQEDEPFNPDYCEVDRILDFTEFEEKILDIPEKDELNETVDIDKNKIDGEVQIKEEQVEKIEKSDSIEDETKEENKAVEEEKLEKTELLDVINKDDKEEGMVEKEQQTNEEKIEDNKDEEKNSNETEALADKTTNLNDEKSEELVEKVKEDEKDDDKLVDEKSNDNKDETKEEDKKAVEEAKTPKMKTRKIRHFLVKWKGLAYEESTWELEDDLDPVKVADFFRFRQIPPKDKWKLKKKPKPADFKKKEESPIYKNGNKLREYQLEGVNWLMFCWYNNKNCILADEMGLGKTIQSLTYVQEIANHGIWGPFLVIVPLSTIGNWQREFESWTNLNVITYHGSSASRNTIDQYEMYYRNEKGERIEGIYKFQVMITTFEVILTDCVELSQIPWKTCVIDEAHRLKNRNCKLLEGLRLFSFDHRVLLTGTPLQNNVEELFSLLNFLEPQQFGSSELFIQEFGDLKTEDQVTKLKAILKPMMLRRLKDDVEKSLAPKEETIIEVELTNIQKKYYRAILEKNFSFLNKGTTNSNIGNLMNTMMELRKCCIHPFLINGAEEQITYEFKETKGQDFTQFQTMVQSSGKLVLIDKLLPRLKEDGHRVLIFSQMVRCLDVLEDYLVQKRYPYERIDGRIRGSLRQAAIDRYSKPGSDRFVFLLCTRAGGLGINLTAADTVIIFDSDWNPQNDLQAQARCHRIGQKKMVKIYRLICRNTYEREMFDKASLKLGLDRAVLQSMNTDKVTKSGGLSDGQLSKKEIEDLLKKGAYGALMDDDNAGDKFCEEDIEQILQRRTQVVTIESGEEKGSTFSKASFAASDNTDIEIDDPEFWKKFAQKANFELEDTTKNELIVEEPRRRTQTRRFGQDEPILDISDPESNSDDDDNISNRTRGTRSGKLSKRDKKGSLKRGRAGYERDEETVAEFSLNNMTRAECFKIEKGLLTFGWNRWDEILKSSVFRRKIEIKDIEDVARIIVLFSCQNYKGDEKIKNFAYDLIAPAHIKEEQMKNEELQNSLNKRKRKSKKSLEEQEKMEIDKLEWIKADEYNPDLLLTDEQYRKHLIRHANKVVLRIKLLNYLKYEILGGDLLEQISNNIPVKDLHIPYLTPDGEPLCEWWDEEADKSLVVGIYKHGFDHYNQMRLDPALCFLQRCGPPDGSALLAELNEETIEGEELVKQLDEEIIKENKDTDENSKELEENKESIDTNREASIEIKKEEYSEKINSNENEEKPIMEESKFEIDVEMTNKNESLNDVKDVNISADVKEIESMETNVEDIKNNEKDEKIEDENKKDEKINEESIDEKSELELAALEEKQINNEEIKLEEIEKNQTNETCENKEGEENTKSVLLEELAQGEEDEEALAAQYLLLPSASDLNQRFRKIVTAHQRNLKKQEIRLSQQARNQQRLEKLEKFEAITRENKSKKQEQAQKKWSRREENEFCKVVSTFGVEYNKKTDTFDWNKFRTFNKFDKKMDETLTEYYKAFYAMCKKVLNKKLTAEEESYEIVVEPISEEKATRCLARIDLINRVRCDILTNKKLEQRLKLCQPSIDLPNWWIAGKHDKDLIIGVGKYGLSRLDYNLINDPDFSFKEQLKIEESKLSAAKKEELNSSTTSLLNSINSVATAAPVDASQSRLLINEENQLANKLNKGKYKDLVEKTLNELCTEDCELEQWREIISDSRDILENLIDCVIMNPPERKSSRDSLLNKNPDDPDFSLLSQRTIMKWPKDRILVTRIENICHCVEKNEWPIKQVPTYLSNSAASLNSAFCIDSSPKSPGSLNSTSREPTPHPTPDQTPRRDCSSPLMGNNSINLFNNSMNSSILPSQSIDNQDSRSRKRRRRGNNNVTQSPINININTSTSLSPSISIGNSKISTPPINQHHSSLIDQLNQQQKLNKQQQQLQQQKQQQLERKLHESIRQQQMMQQQSNKKSNVSSNQQNNQQQLNNQLANNPLANNPLFKSLFPSPLLNMASSSNASNQNADNKPNLNLSSLLGDEKTALLLQNALKAKAGNNMNLNSALLQALQAATNQQANQSSLNTRLSSLNSKSQGNNNKRGQNVLDPLDFTFTKASKLSNQLSSGLKSKEQNKNDPILDLTSQAPTFRKDEKSSAIENERSLRKKNQSQNNNSNNKNSGNDSFSKLIGNRIDSLALNLQSKKGKSDSKNDGSSSENNKTAASRLEALKKELLLQQLQQQAAAAKKQQQSQPPPSAQLPPLINPLNTKLLETLSLFNKINSTPVKTAKEQQEKNALLKQNLKKIMDEHPEILSALPALQNSSLLNQSSANNLTTTTSSTSTSSSSSVPTQSTSSSIPANTELLELPEGRRKMRSSTGSSSTSASSSSQNLSSSKEDNLSVLNKLAAATKKAQQQQQQQNASSSNSKLNQNLLSELGIGGNNSINSGNLKSSTRNNDQQQKPKLDLEALMQLASNSKNKAAASLLAQQQQQNQQQNQSSSSNNQQLNPIAQLLAQQSASKNQNNLLNMPGLNLPALAGLNPSLLMNLPGFNKMMLEQVLAGKNMNPPAPPQQSSSSNNSNNNSSQTSNNNQNNPLNIPGLNLSALAGLNPSLLNLPGLNLPNLAGLNTNLLNNNLLQNKLNESISSQASSTITKESSKQSLSNNSSSTHASSSSSKQQSNSDKNSSSNQSSSSSNKNKNNNLPNIPGFNPNLLNNLGNLNNLNNLPFNPLSALGNLPGLQNTPFASLAQSNLLNGFGNLPGLNNLLNNVNKSSSSSNKQPQQSQQSPSNNPLSKAALAALASGNLSGNNQFNLANMASLLANSKNPLFNNFTIPTSTANQSSRLAASSSSTTSKNTSSSKVRESDEESLRSLMEQDDDLDYNDDSGSDYETTLRKRSLPSGKTRSQAKRKCTESSKSKK